MSNAPGGDARPVLAVWAASTGPLSPFAAVCGVGLLGRLSYEMARSPLTPLFAKHLGAPVQLIGLIVAAVTISGIVVKLPAGALSDVFGYRPLMMLGAIVKATGPFFYLLATSWGILLGVRFYHGLATALYAPPASALISDAYPDQRGRRLGLYNAAENAGSVLGPILGGFVLTATLSNFHLAFAAAGVIGVLAFLVMLRVPKDALTRAPSRPSGTAPLRDSLRETSRNVRMLLGDPGIRLISLVEAVLWLGIGSVQAYMPIYTSAIGLPVWQIGLIAGAQGTASVLSRPILGRYSDRLASRAPLVAIGSILCIGSITAIPHVATFWMLIVLAAVFGLGTGIVTPSTMAMIGDRANRRNMGSAMGVFGSLWDTGHAAGPVLFGFLLLGFGYRTSWLIMGGIMSAALIIFLAQQRRLVPTR